MSNILLSYTNYVDDGTLTTDDEVSGLGVENLAKKHLSSIWRTSGTSAYFQVDFGSDKTVKVLGLGSTRSGVLFAAGDKVQHYLDADGGTAGTGAVYDSGQIDIDYEAGYGCHYHDLSATGYTARYWRCQLDISASSLTYIQLSRAWAGDVLEPSLGVAWGIRRGWIDLGSAHRAARSGVRYSDIAQKLRFIDAEIRDMTNTEAEEIEELIRYVGTTRQVFAVRTTSEISVGRRAMFAQMQNADAIVQTNYGFSDFGFRLLEDQ